MHITRYKKIFASLLLCTSLVPQGMHAAATVIEIQRAPATQRQVNRNLNASISRGDFLRISMNVLGFELIHDTKKKPFPRIPESLLPYVQTADALGALKVFGRSLNSARPITRSEAIQILVELQASGEIAKDPLPPLADVQPNTEEGKAIALALERGWVESDSRSVFGAKRVLKVGEAEKLLGNVLASEGRSMDNPVQTIVVPITRIRPDSVNKPLPKENIQRAVWNLLNNEYLYKDRLNDEQAGNGSVEGLLKDLKDPYTVFLPPAKSQSFQEQLMGEITGIGATVEMVEKFLVIIAPLPGSPAEKAGLRARDIILSVDGTELKDMDLDTAVSKVRGPKGSIAKLRILRDGVERDYSVVRDSIQSLEINASWQGTVAVVRLLQFGQTTAQNIRKTFEEIVKQNPTGVILDLRNNPGGLVSSAEAVSSVFLPLGTVYLQTEAKGTTTKEKTQLPPVLPANTKVVVLVNAGSASASEIVAGALQDTKRAKIFGKKTFGKGTVQQIFTFTDGSSLKMTVASWMTTNGRHIDGAGITPDVILEENAGDRDEQLLRAIDALR